MYNNKKQGIICTAILIIMIDDRLINRMGWERKRKNNNEMNGGK